MTSQRVKTQTKIGQTYQQVLLATQPVQISAAKCQGSKLPVNNSQQLLRFGHAQGYVACIEVFHVVATLKVFMHDAASHSFVSEHTQ